MTDKWLAGQVAVITGGTKGLGWAIAQEYAAQGATVVCASRTGAVDTPVDAWPGHIVFDSVDVRDPDSVLRLVERTVTAYERVDILVANAGVNLDSKVERVTVADWDETLATNLSGTLYAIKAVVPRMRGQGGGRIVTVSSSMATRPAIGTAGYVVSKAGIEALTRVAAIELGRHGILVNCLAPGILDAGMGRAVLDNDTLRQAYTKRFGLGRPGRTQEAAQVALWLAGPHSSYVNGAVIEANGGLSWA